MIVVLISNLLRRKVNYSNLYYERSVAQWLRRCITKPTVVGLILADATIFTDFVPFSTVLKPDCLFTTYYCAEAFILQWIDTVWNLFFT